MRQPAAACPERGRGRWWARAVAVLLLLHVGVPCAPAQVRSAHLGATSKGSVEARLSQVAVHGMPHLQALWERR